MGYGRNTPEFAADLSDGSEGIQRTSAPQEGQLEKASKIFAIKEVDLFVSERHTMQQKSEIR